MLLLASTKQWLRCALSNVILLVVLLPALSLAEQSDRPLAALLVQSANVSSPAQSKILLDNIHQYLAKDLSSLATPDFVGAADAYGNLVVGAQEQGVSQAGLSPRVR